MMNRLRISSLLAVVLALLTAARTFAADLPLKGFELEVERQRSGLSWERLNDDDLPDMLIADDSSFYIYYQTPDFTFTPANMQELPAAGGAALYDLADLDGDKRMELIVMTAASVDVFVYDPATKAMVKRAEPLVSDLRGVTVQHLAPADFMFDLDRDGDEDLIFPLDGRYYLYFNDGAKFSKTNQVTTKPIRIRMDTGRDRLRDKIETSITIPRLAFSDLNGDGRLDLRSSNGDLESFYVQSADGSIPENPAYEVNLKKFKDQAPKQTGDIKIDQHQFIPQDLNGDKREDYVIVAGNKLWVFLADEKGVDFNTPAQIVKVSAEYMTVVLMPLNEDDQPDLLILKYQIPSLGRIIAGLAIGLRFEVEFLGYDNETKGFSRTPTNRSTMTFKIPPLLKLLGELEDLQKQFKDIEKRSRAVSGGDLTGDGRRDVVKAGEDTLDLYITPESAGEVKTDFETEQGDFKFYKRVFFGERHRDVTLDTLMKFFSDTVTAFQDEAIAGRTPDQQLKIGAETSKRIRQIICRDINADGKDDLIVLLGPPEGKEGEDLPTQTMAFWVSASR